MIDPSEVTVETLTDAHDRSAFLCGLSDVDVWFQAKSLAEEQNGRVRTHVIAGPGGEIQAFFALKHIVVNLEDASKSMRRGAEFGSSETALLLAQMGVHEEYQGNGAGRFVMNRVLCEAARLHQGASFRFLVVDAGTESLIDFYKKFQFQVLANDRRLIMKMSAVLRIAAALEN